MQTKYTYKFTVTDEMVSKFADATGDYNPVHLNEDYAKNTVFKSRIAHGFLIGSLISNIFGTKFPGPGTIYLSQTLKFHRPVYIDDKVLFEINVLEYIPEKRHLKCETICKNSNKKICLSGEALLLVPEQL